MPKIKKTLLWLNFDPERDGKGSECEKKKFSFLSIPNRLGIGNSRKIAKKFKKFKKNQFGFISRKNGTGEAENVRKKNYHSDPF